MLAGEQGDYASADALHQESLDIARQLGDKRGVAVSLNALAVTARDRGDVQVARSLFEESLALWRELGDQKAVARSLSNLANVVKLQGDYARARSLYAECLSIFQGLGDRTGVAWSMNYQGDVARDQGDSAAARTLYEQGLAIFRELGDRWGIAGTLADLGSLAREQGDYPAARLSVPGKHKAFSRNWTTNAESRACWSVSRAQRPLNSKPSVRCGWRARRLRYARTSALRSRRRNKPNWKQVCIAARQALTNTAGATAWLEGWALPIEKAIEEVLMPQAASRVALALPRGRLTAKRIGTGRFTPGSLRACRIDESAHGGDAIGRNTYAPGVFLDGRFVRREINTIHLVAGHVAVKPLDLGTHSLQNADRLLGDFPQLGVG